MQSIESKRNQSRARLSWPSCLVIFFTLAIPAIAPAESFTSSYSSLKDPLSTVRQLQAVRVEISQAAAKPPAKSATTAPSKPLSYRGWSRLVKRLKRDGVDPALVDRVYTDSRMPAYTPVQFGPAAPEAPALYTPFFNTAKLQQALNFIQEHAHAFQTSEKKYHVNRFVVCAIILVETHLGKNPGKHLVIERLSRLSSAPEAANIDFNLQRLRRLHTPATKAQLEKRAKDLESLFYPELKALFEIARRQHLDILTLRGSTAGAFGIPQFLPSSFLKYAVDGNNDQGISLFQPDDAIASAANYLAGFGWNDYGTHMAQRQVIWSYNHSDAYIDTVLKIAKRLRQLDKEVEESRVKH